MSTNPESEVLLHIINKYNMPCSINDIVDNIKSNFNLIFSHSIEKYVFLNFTASDFYKYLKCGLLNTKNEYYFIKGIIIWAMHDIASRIGNVNRLLSTINTFICDRRTLLANMRIATGSSKLNEIIKKLLLEISIQNDPISSRLLEGFHERSISPPTVSPPLPLYAVASQGIYSLNPTLLVHRHDFGLASNSLYTSNRLYVVNHTDGVMFRYDLLTSTITSCDYPREFRFVGPNYSIHMTHINSKYPPTINETATGDLIMIGGRISKFSYSCSVHHYDVGTDIWTPGHCLPLGRCGHSTVVVERDVYVIGGITLRGVSDEVLRYRDGVWTSLALLLVASYSHVSLLRGGCIYVYGGVPSGKPVRYDIAEDRWSSIDSHVFNVVLSSTCVHDAYANAFYAYTNNNVYSICIESKRKTLLYKNIDLKLHRLVLMDLHIT